MVGESPNMCPFDQLPVNRLFSVDFQNIMINIAVIFMKKKKTIIWGDWINTNIAKKN